MASASRGRRRRPKVRVFVRVRPALAEETPATDFTWITQESASSRRTKRSGNGAASRPLSKSGTEISAHRDATAITVETARTESVCDGITLLGRNEGGKYEQVEVQLGKRRFRGFDGIFGAEADNEAVFNATVKPLIPLIVKGGTVCVFAYGHTGSGKTHTTLGNAETGVRGMPEAIADTLHTLLADSEQFASDASDASALCFEVRFTDIYMNKARDLLRGGAAAEVRADASGSAHVRGCTTVDEETGDVWVEGLAPSKTPIEAGGAGVLAIVREALQARVVGCSTHHSESSRSHAILEIELITEALATAREAVRTAHAALAPAGKAYHDATIGLYELAFKSYVRHRAAKAGKPIPSDKTVLVTTSDHKEFVGCHPWFSSIDMMEAAEFEQRIRDTPELDVSVLELAKEIPSIKIRFDEARARLEHEEEALCLVQAAAPVSAGGTAVIVDLAGNEFAADAKSSKGRGAHQTAAAASSSSVAESDASTDRRNAEMRAINASLFSLKECVRALAKGSKSAHHFRGSPLTRLLQRHLCESSAEKPSRTIMIATTSPDAEDTATGKTANTLTYAAMMASSS